MTERLLGSGNAALGKDAPHHGERFDFDERALETGVELLVRAAERVLLGG